MTTPRFLLEEKFRSNPRYELMEWNRLSQSEQQALTGLSKNEEAFGLFVPVHEDPQLTYKVAYKEVALLYYTLLHQQVLPAYTRLEEKEEMNESIARLVLEGVLEMEWQEEFVSGAAAHQAIYEVHQPPECKRSPDRDASRISDLSLQALEYAILLEELDTRSIASRLYNYNTLPDVAERMSAFRTLTGLEDFLGIAPGAPYEWQLNRHWQKHTASAESKWISWSRKGVQQDRKESDLTYKLYISPNWEALPKTLVLSIKALSSSAAFSFKIGNDPHGLLRSDKMVVYFQRYEDLLQTAAALEPALDGVEAQGVPFTAQLDKKGLLSWGVDPPGADVLENFEGGSWRARLTDKLAAAITNAKAAGLQRQDILPYALHKIGLEGLDTGTWTPGRQIWQ